MAGRIRSHGWAATPLGPVERWPAALRTTVGLLSSPSPISILWGPDCVQLYNDAYVPIAAERHSVALGRTAAENWSEAYGRFPGLIFDRVFAGETVTIDEHAVSLRTPDGAVSERFFTGTFLPTRDDRGEIVGRTHWEAWPGSEESELGRTLKSAMAGRAPVALHHRYA